MTLDELHSKDLIVFECLGGSHAYGLDTPESDVDVRGVFILPKEDYFGLAYTPQVSDESNDTVYYELKRFVELLSKSNPNALELLYSPDDCIKKCDPVFETLRKMNLLSKQCKDSFGGYAMTQVRKAKGLNKKIHNPVEPQRKSILDFCYIAEGQGSIPLTTYLTARGWQQEQCGLSKIPHMHEMYALYHGGNGYRGILRKEDANQVALTSIPKGVQPVALLSFNKSGYSKYCKEYKEYWSWVQRRNETRYQNTLEHGKHYDAKNMMHTIRLLSMCEEIGRFGRLHVRRPDREYLLGIKRGEFDYEELLAQAEGKIAAIDKAFAESELPDHVDTQALNRMLVDMRMKRYT